MINDIKRDTEKKMIKSIESLRHEMSKIRTGRASTGLLDHVQVDYYGNSTPLNQLANITSSDSRTLMVTPWEKNMIAAIEKAILNAGLGLNPATSGNAVRVPMPALTEERRKDLIKVVRAEAEQGRVVIRNIRRDSNHELKELLKNKSIAEDDERRGNDLVQKLTDHYIAEVDTVLAEKEKDLMDI